jgi:hypothetical protein
MKLLKLLSVFVGLVFGYVPESLATEDAGLELKIISDYHSPIEMTVILQASGESSASVTKEVIVPAEGSSVVHFLSKEVDSVPVHPALSSRTFSISFAPKSDLIAAGHLGMSIKAGERSKVLRIFKKTGTEHYDFN